ncbi:MAG TPA: DUF1553 domain-containing protein [Bryobacteraceae bacterium]|nr:DUF1553 domain-containing protein [Bryobacteraceae bacterium]
MSPLRAVLLPLATLAGFAAAQAQTPLKNAKIDFDRQIRPILSDTCFTCHGPDQKMRMGGLRLDDKESAFRVLHPGQRGESKLFQRISAADVKKRMPPPGFDRKLTKDQVELIGKWIDQGAEWQTHWSYTPPVRAELPAVNEKTWPRNAIDHFVLARLEKEGVKHAAEADKVTLARRVTLDITGLPPTPPEVQAFVSDRTPNAYEKLVDRLLESPHYGERMAMQWLDLARYADTHGYHIDSHREMWPWRDWVIRAFNKNLPYDQFTLLQLAGDLLPGATPEQKLATGFNRNHMINYEGGAIADEYLVEYNVDRVETTSVVWMGMTMGCARCHDHKYDPISQRDFYRFFAFFNNVDEKGLDGREGNAKPFLPLPDPIQAAREKEMEQAIASREKMLPEADVAAAVELWLKNADPSYGPPGAAAHYELDGSFSDSGGKYRHAKVISGNPTFSNGPAGQAVAFDGETQIDWAATEGEAFSAAFWVRLNNKLEQALLHKMMDGRGVMILSDEAVSIGDLKRGAHLAVRLQGPNTLEVRTKKYVVQNEFTHVVVNYDGSGKAAGVTLYLDGEPAALETLKDSLGGPVANAAVWSSGNKAVYKPVRSQLDDVRLYSRILTAAEARQLSIDAPVRGILNTPAAKRSKDQNDRLRDYYLSYVAPEDLKKAYTEWKQLKLAKTRLEKEITTAMVMKDLDKPRDTYILARGDYRNRTEKVTPAVPAALPPLPPGVPANRLGLAKWLVDPSHPLTARVAVNRFWQLYFGNGLVETVEDFGSQGAGPTHPQLLDWLATEFIRSGWDIKAMQKLIVTSATYRQVSKATPELIERDPQNKLLARMSRFRLPAEMVRDNALAASGLLNGDIGGKSVYPYQPVGLWEELAYGDVFSAQTYTPSHGKDLYRRSMYTFWKRTVPPAQLGTFDAPDREKCVARRPRTNTPLQALVLMNDPTYIEAARALAQKVISENRDAGARIKAAFRLASARTPSSQELKLLSSLAARQQTAYRKDPESARRLLRVGASKAAHADPVELAAWTTVTSVILNLDEVITKE